jgi:hypothetical protein
MVAALGCGDRPTQPQVGGVSLAKGGKGGGGPKVSETDPDSASQDTTLDVRVLGSGFEPGAVATFLLDGAATDSVRTNSTRFVGARELVANITIAVDAIIDLYDVEVLLAGPGRRGIGADLFAVVEKGSPFADNPEDRPITIEFRDDAVYNIRSDTRGIYVDGECGVKATFNIYDARLDPDANKINRKDRVACGGRQARSVKVNLSQPTGDSPPHELDGTTQDGNFFKVDEVELVTAPGITVQSTAVIHGPFGCALGLRFNHNLDSKSNFVDVTNNGDETWTVATQPDDNDVAVCLPDNNPNAGPARYYHLRFEVTVTLKQ